MADQSPTAEPDIPAPINTTTVVMIVGMLDLMATPSSSNKLPLIGEEAVAVGAREVLRRGSTPAQFKTEV